MNKNFIIIIAITALVGTGGFLGGMKYAQTGDLTSEERQQKFQEMGMADIGAGAGRVSNRTSAGFASGEIISKDEQSITIKLPDGGSKIIFYSDSTEISKFVNGVSDDLEIGSSVTINGKTNQDGSITAQSIQLRTDTMSF